MRNRNPGGCGATLRDSALFKKQKDKNGRRDGGFGASKVFSLQRLMTLYSCPKECLEQEKKFPNGKWKPPTVTDILTHPVPKTSAGTCITWNADPSVGCVKEKANGATDCRPCAGIFNNVD